MIVVPTIFDTADTTPLCAKLSPENVMVPVIGVVLLYVPGMVPLVITSPSKYREIVEPAAPVTVTEVVAVVMLLGDTVGVTLIVPPTCEAALPVPVTQRGVTSDLQPLTESWYQKV